jgi:hypothetical protein
VVDAVKASRGTQAAYHGTASTITAQ